LTEQAKIKGNEQQFNEVAKQFGPIGYKARSCEEMTRVKNFPSSCWKFKERGCFEASSFCMDGESVMV
jgi:hypothetical protein